MQKVEWELFSAFSSENPRIEGILIDAFKSNNSHKSNMNEKVTTKTCQHGLNLASLVLYFVSHFEVEC